jgi:hypothetical protein
MEFAVLRLERQTASAMKRGNGQGAEGKCPMSKLKPETSNFKQTSAPLDLSPIILYAMP